MPKGGNPFQTVQIAPSAADSTNNCTGLEGRIDETLQFWERVDRLDPDLIIRGI